MVSSSAVIQLFILILFCDLDGLLENVVVCRGFSKTLGAQSWRLAYVVSHPETIKLLMSHHDPVYIRYTTSRIHNVSNCKTEECSLY